IALALFTIFAVGVWYSAQLAGANAELRKAVEAVERQRVRAEDRELGVRREAYAMHIRMAAELLADPGQGIEAELLNALGPAADQEDVRGFEWRYLWGLARRRLILRGHRASVRAVAFSADGSHCASVDSDGATKLWNPSNGALVADLGMQRLWPYSIAFSA